MKHSRDKFKDKLQSLDFSKFNLTEEDARYFLSDVVQPIYTGIFYLYLLGNDIQSIQSLGTAAKTMNGPITSNLQCLNIDENPVYENLKSPESTDHKAAVCLAKSFPKLWAFSWEDSKTLSFMNYQTMINFCDLRYLLEDGKGNGGTRLSLWPYVIHNVYEMTSKDPNTIYYFLREGLVIKDRYSFPPLMTRQRHQHRLFYYFCCQKMCRTMNHNDDRR
jgi:hypothetical protein